MIKKLIIALLFFSLFITNGVFANSYGLKNGDFVQINGYKFQVLDQNSNYLIHHGNLENRAFGNNIFYSTSHGVGKYLNTVFLNNLNFSKYIESRKYGDINAKVGLISLSEYQNYRNNFYYKNGDGTVWWTLTPVLNGWNNSLYGVSQVGTVGTGIIYNYMESFGVRPTIKLVDSEDIGIMSGTGTLNDPYIISDEIKFIPDVISELSLVNSGFNFIELHWKNPVKNFKHIEIYIDDQFYITTTEESYRFEKLQHNKEYKFTFVTVSPDGYKSSNIDILITTDDIPIIGEVSNLKAISKYNRVDLSWTRPQSEFFHHVKISRKEIAKKTTFNLLETISPSIAYADDGEYTPLFETNGTYFNDLTVKSETTYEYKLQTENIAGYVSEGVTIQVTTPSPPPPEMGGVDFGQNEKGDYVYKWTSPTTGKVKIFVGGKEYAIVPASDRQITIPKEDMKYTVMGNPDVRLVPISENGKEGKPINPNIPFSGTQLPLNVDDLLTTSMGFLWLLGPFILLVLAIIIAQKLIQIIRKSVEARKQGGVINERRRS